MSTAEAKQVAKNYAEYLRKKHYPFDHIYLFGSFARGDFSEDSDIDIAVISKKFSETDTNKWFENRFELGRMRLDIDLRIEPHGLSPEEFENEDSAMAVIVKEYGIKIEV